MKSKERIKLFSDNRATAENVFRSSATYNYFRTYRKNDERFSDSMFGRLFLSDRLYNSIKVFKNIFAKSCENSVIINSVKRAYSAFLSSDIRTIVSVLLYFSVYSLLVGVAKLIFGASSQNLISEIYFSTLFLLVSMVLFFLKGSIGTLSSNSIIVSKISDLFFVFSKDSKSSNARTNNAIVVLVGTALGLLTAIIPAKNILFSLLFIFLVLSFFKAPENSFPFLLISGLFLSERTHLILCIFAFSAYVFKALRGKRSFNLRFFDLLFLLFVLIVLFFGINGDMGYTISVVSYCCIYFLFRNCIKSEQHGEKVLNSVFLSAFIASLVVLYERLVSWGYLDLKVLTILPLPHESIHSICGFLALAFPFVLGFLVVSKYNNSKIFSLLTAFLSCLALISSGDKGIVISLCACVIIYIASSLRKPLTAVFFVVASYVLLTVLNHYIPLFGTEKFLSISEQTKNISMTTVSIIKDNFVSGIGIAPNRFSEFYRAYTGFGSNTPSFSNNIFLQFFVCFGFFGFIYFLYISLNYFKMQFTVISENKKFNSINSVVAVASLSAVTSVFIRGLTSFPLSDPRMLFMLMVALGLSSAMYHNSENTLKILCEE